MRGTVKGNAPRHTLWPIGGAAPELGEQVIDMQCCALVAFEHVLTKSHPDEDAHGVRAAEVFRERELLVCVGVANADWSLVLEGILCTGVSRMRMGFLRSNGQMEWQVFSGTDLSDEE